ncbi:hypothetical protein [Micromonospora maritima]|uniref:hypothetical protein n=1 Tax=Micromonospora maritima TaxID=986711 RepID=UPI00157D3690|nr:hypothetical protein [Micromonospora maritima]
MDTNTHQAQDGNPDEVLGVNPAFAGKRIVMYVDETMLTERGYRPVMIVEGERGFHEQGDPERLQEPWYFGHDFRTAKRLVDEANERLGISPEEALKIVFASMFGNR